MEAFRICARLIGRIIVWIVAIAIVIVIWYKAAGLIVWLLDFNLRVIKAACAYLPAPYGAMAESALRGGLGADKALLFAEGTFAVKTIAMLLWRLVRPRKKHIEPPASFGRLGTHGLVL